MSALTGNGNSHTLETVLSMQATPLHGLAEAHALFAWLQAWHEGELAYLIPGFVVQACWPPMPLPPMPAPVGDWFPPEQVGHGWSISDDGSIPPSYPPWYQPTELIGLSMDYN